MKTNAVRLLETLGVQYELREYDVDPDDLAAETVAAKIEMPPEQVFKTLLARGALEALAMVAKAGDVVSGFGKVEDALSGGRAVALIHAADGASDGIRKLNAKWAASGGQTAQKQDFTAINGFTTDELDLALGRSNVVHAALLSGPATKTFLTRWHTLERFRHPDGEAQGKTGEN